MREMREQKLNDGDASFTSRFRRRSWWWRGGTGGSGVAFDVVSVPGEVALEAVFEVRGRGETMKFAGIDDEFGGAAEAFQRLIHLLAAENGDVPVDVSAHEESGSGDVADAIEG